MRSDAGAGTVAAIGLAALVVAVASVLAPVGAIAVARHRAAAVADAAAIAAAAVIGGVATGLGHEPCAAAVRVAERHATELRGCDIDGVVVAVEVAAGGPFGAVIATAVAGPPTG